MPDWFVEAYRKHAASEYAYEKCVREIWLEILPHLATLGVHVE